MVEQDWASVETLLLGLWPRRELPAAHLYVRLLAPFPLERVERAVTELAKTVKFAPSPAQLLQATLNGGRPEPDGGPVSMEERYQAHRDEVDAFLRQHFPHLVDERGYLHPAAVAAVGTLEFEHGRGNVRVREHGPFIREAVKRFDAKYGTGGSA